MTGELEVHHSPQLRFLLCTHYLFTHILIGNAVGIGTGLCIRTQVLEIIRHCIVEQRQAVIEDGRRGDNFAEKLYVQVTYLLATDETIEREFGAYVAIRDNFPKYVVSLDEFDRSRDGIKHRNLRDFLLAEKWD